MVSAATVYLVEAVLLTSPASALPARQGQIVQRSVLSVCRKRQTILNRDKSALPAYDVMRDEPSDNQDAPQPTIRAAQQQFSKLIVHAPSDPGVVIYVTVSLPAYDMPSPNGFQTL